MTMNSNGSEPHMEVPDEGQPLLLDQYLSFYLDNELFAMNIGVVREILDDMAITRIPRTPDFMRGVLNVRGHAVPVVDLRLKFGMSPTEMTVNTCVIITEVEMEGEQITIGALADSVQEVLELRPEEIHAPPKMGTVIDTGYIQGMARHNDGFIVLLEISRVFTCEELIGIAGTTDSAE